MKTDSNTDKWIIRIFIGLFVLLIGISFVSANIATDLESYYTFDADATDSFNNNDGTVTGASLGIGVINDAYIFDGSGDYITMSNTNFSYEYTDPFSISFWVNFTGTATDRLIGKKTGAGSGWEIFTGSGYVYFNENSAGHGVMQERTSSTINSLTWRHVVITTAGAGSAAGTIFYVDGSAVATAVDADTLKTDTGTIINTELVSIGRQGVTDEFTGGLDEIGIWNRVLNTTEIAYLYNSGSGARPPFFSPLVSSITFSTDLVADINVTDYPYTFNVSGSALANAPDAFNCSLYLNTTLNQTLYDIPLNNTYASFNLSYGMEQKGYDINVTCINTNLTKSIQKNNVFIDSVTPYINFLSPVLNNTIFYKNFDTLVNATILCDDPNLFSCNLTLGRLSALGVMNETLNNSFYTNINTSNQTATILRSLATMPNGEFILIGESADSHTAKEIKSYKTTKLDSKLEKGYLIEDKIKITSKDLKSMELIKEKDRYKFDMDFTQSNPEIVVECQGDVTYLPDSAYKGHLVCFDERKWIDFEDDSQTPVLVERLSKNKVKVTPLSTDKTFKFKSIGDLNINRLEYFLNVTEMQVDFSMSVYDEDNPTIPLIADAEIEFDYYLGASPNIINYYADLSGSDTYIFNVSTNESTIRGDLYIKYTTALGFTHRYILVNTTFDAGVTNNLTLYNFNTTTDISDLKITARLNTNYNYYTDVLARLQRRYTAEGLWRTVQMDLSGDFGVLFFNIREQSTDYRIIFLDHNNNVLKTTDTLKFVCDSGVCDLTTLLDPYAATAASTDISISYLYNNQTKLLNYTWIDNLGGTNTVRMRARKDTITGAVYPCDSTQIGASGIYSCNLTGISGLIEVTATANGNIILNEFLDLKGERLGDNIDEREGALWSALILIVCVTFGIFSPMGAIIAMIIGLIAIYLLGIFTPLTMTVLIITTVIGIVIGFKLRQ